MEDLLCALGRAGELAQPCPWEGTGRRARPLQHAHPLGSPLGKGSRHQQEGGGDTASRMPGLVERLG